MERTLTLDTIFISHRSLSHSVLGTFLAYKILAIFLPLIFNPNYVNSHIVLISIMIGYISHLLADMATKDGLPLLYPYKKKFGIPPVSKFRITTGALTEKFIIFPGVIFYILWFVGAYKENLVSLLRLIN